MFPHEFLELQEKERKQPQKKISNSFIQNVITNSKETALKIVWYLASVLNKYDTKKDLDTYVLNEKDIVDSTGIKISTIRKNLKAMQKTSVSFIDEKKKLEEYVSLIPRIKINYDGTFEIDLYTKIAVLIIDVANRNNTFIDISQLLRLNNKHSIRLLPLLKTISEYTAPAKKEKSLSLKDLNGLFGTKYTRFSYIESKILKKLKIELDANSNISFNYKMNKRPNGKGRPSIQDITIIPTLNNHYQSTIFSNFEDAPVEVKKDAPEPKEVTTGTTEKQKELVAAPTDDEINYALNECNLNPQDAVLKFEQFTEWKKGKRGRRSFKKYLLDGIKNGW